eukprot:CAMPEP_0113380136 /NCGR_PEP_ID=MMETSP0013_2-20120614/4598_1 /TAXON_ID=2843 ORGANISM="Skeletonema costatum, Strain 1716" /NCGR_SAMPLE_ID=MMETSP0013_2 /ASSEMBLY_ACC=CAM_ASM_000158 /LENGTH=225 /DNA_ID=CAMNT_0000262457 /DNA_START=89 /DNA_END=766 /DNA_ORIENTATION=- /assembly_acc=CAM_ASM_000158
MAPPTATSSFYDPWAAKQTQHSPDETAALLDLLAVDNLIDSKAPLATEHNLLNDLLAVDLEFSRADNRIHNNVITAPELKEQRDVFLDLLAVDQEVDHARRVTATSSLDQHFSSTTDLCDPYVPRAHAIVHPFTGVYAADNDGVGKASDEQQLRDNAILVHLLFVDESVDNSKRWNKFVESDSYAILEDLYEVDREVSGAKRRETLVEDLQALWDVDCLMNGAGR